MLDLCDKNMWDLFCQLLFMYLIYVDSPFHDCFMTFVMYISDVFIAQMGAFGINILDRSG